LQKGEKGEQVEHTGHTETPTTRASPFIVHNTSLFNLHPKSGHVHSNQLIATEALETGFKKKKKKICTGWFPTPSTRQRRGGKGKRRQGTTIRKKGSMTTAYEAQGITVGASQRQAATDFGQ